MTFDIPLFLSGILLLFFTALFLMQRFSPNGNSNFINKLGIKITKKMNRDSEQEMAKCECDCDCVELTICCDCKGLK